jgi:hypothetical protein
LEREPQDDDQNGRKQRPLYAQMTRMRMRVVGRRFFLEDPLPHPYPFGRIDGEHHF